MNDYAMRYASAHGHLEVVKYLYSIECNPRTWNDHAIKWASQYGHLDVVKYLFSIGCDPRVDYDFA
jgi:ankyrin repeat protein